MEVEKEEEPIPSLLSIQTSRGDEFSNQQDSNWQQSSGWNTHSQHHWRKSKWFFRCNLHAENTGKQCRK